MTPEQAGSYWEQRDILGEADEPMTAKGVAFRDRPASCDLLYTEHAHAQQELRQVIRDVFSDQPGRPKPVLTPEAPDPLAVKEANRSGKTAAKNDQARRRPAGQGLGFLGKGTTQFAEKATQDGDSNSARSCRALGQFAAKFLAAVLTLLGSLASSCDADARATGSFGQVERGLSALSAGMGRPNVRVPLRFGQTASIRQRSGKGDILLN